MDHKRVKDSLNLLFQDKNIPSEASKKSMLQFQQQKKKKKIYVLPVVVTSILFISCVFLIFSLMGELKQTAKDREVTPLDPQSIVHYSLEVNGEEVPKDGKVEAKINGERVTIEILQQELAQQTKDSEEELTNAYLSDNVEDHFIEMDKEIWEEYRKDEGKTNVFGFQTKSIESRDSLTVFISDELKNRLQLTTNTIIIDVTDSSKVPVNIATDGQKDETLKNALQQGIYNLYELNNDSVNLVHSVHLQDSVAVVDLTDEFIDIVNPTLGSHAKRELMKTVNKIMFSREEIDTVYYTVNGDSNRWWSLMESVQKPISRNSYYQSFVTYRLFVNDEEVNNQSMLKVKKDKIQIGIERQMTEDIDDWQNEEIERADISGSELDHLIGFDSPDWEIWGTDGTLVTSVGYEAINYQGGETFTFEISDELKNRLELKSNIIQILVE